VGVGVGEGVFFKFCPTSRIRPQKEKNCHWLLIVPALKMGHQYQ